MFFLLIPTYVRRANECLRTHLGRESLPFDRERQRGKRTTPVFRRLLWVLCLVFLSLTCIVSVLNARSLWEVESLMKWYAPSLETIPTSAFFFAMCAILGLAAGVFLAFHYSVMFQLRRMISEDHTSELEWSVTEGGPIHLAFSSYLYLLYPVAIIPIGVILMRTLRVHFSPLDPVTLFNIIIIPVGIIIWIVFPFTLTGIPRHLRMRRRELLQGNAKEMTGIWRRICDGAYDAKRASLLKQMDCLAKEREFVMKYYPRLSLSKRARIIPAVLSLVALAISLVRTVIELSKGNM